MAHDWTDSEIAACTRTYLWMLEAINNGFNPVKKRVREALLAGPLKERTDSSIEFRFQNISSVLSNMGEKWMPGYMPAANVGTTVTASIEGIILDYRRSRHGKRVSWLIPGIPDKLIKEAAERLADGELFIYPDSVEFDVKTENGERLPPKKVIGYASLLHYKAPLMPVHFSGGESTVAFAVLRSAGLTIEPKIDPETKAFRKTVTKAKNAGFNHRPEGESIPAKYSITLQVRVRDPKVVAYVELRAKGFCELCGHKAPFERETGEPFLEVHHIEPLGANGPDTVDNAVALCPNCHRECHHGKEAAALKLRLLKVISSFAPCVTED